MLRRRGRLPPFLLSLAEQIEWRANLKIETIPIQEMLRTSKEEYQELLHTLAQVKDDEALKITCEDKKQQGRVSMFLYRMPELKVSCRGKGAAQGKYLIFVAKRRK